MLCRQGRPGFPNKRAHQADSFAGGFIDGLVLILVTFCIIVLCILFQFGAFREKARVELLALGQEENAHLMKHRMPHGVKNLQAFVTGGKKYIRMDGCGVLEFQDVSEN